MVYDYYGEMKEDIENALEDETYQEIIENGDDYDEIYEKLYDSLWTDDSVTGNGSGSYTFNRDKAVEYLSYNFDLLSDALIEFDCSVDDLAQGPEWCDVTIRCYLLGQILNEVLTEMNIER